jgi:multimeric flavodoxin WrbA
MKITAIIGTGVKNGTIDKMSKAIIKGAIDAGHQTTVLYLSEYSISPCLGCFRCLGDANCIIKDDFHKLYQACAEADVLILGTPVYMGNISGLMKNFFDRHNGNAMYNPPLMAKLKKYPPKERKKLLFSIMKEYRPKEEMQGKKIIRVVAANKPRILLAVTGELRTTYHALSSYIKDMKCKLYGTLLFCGTQMNPEHEEKILKKAYQMGKSLS